jgi:DNA-binding NarL/FixJ family response regulator
VVLHEEGGKFFRERDAKRFATRGGRSRLPARILILDPVVGSRFALARVAAQPGVLAETASTIDEARACLARGGVALILVEDDLGEGVRGLEFLVEVRDAHPAVRRALVVAEDAPPIRRAEIERAGLAFLLSKPWDAEILRSAIRESIVGEGEFASWSHRRPVAARTRPAPARPGRGDEIDRRLDLLARGLLAGLNSCESEPEVFELLHAELAASLDSQRWLWVDEDRGAAGRIVDDWPLESEIEPETLPAHERALLDDARRSTRITRLDRGRSDLAGPAATSTCIGFALKDGGRRVVTALVWVAPELGSAVIALLREIHSGLALAFRRIHDAEARALAARRLARRVSEELRTPVGALSHAIDRLRGEAERAGMSTEWVDRVSSESQRLARAVELFEDEIFTESGERLAAAN